MEDIYRKKGGRGMIRISIAGTDRLRMMTNCSIYITLCVHLIRGFMCGVQYMKLCTVADVVLDACVLLA